MTPTEKIRKPATEENYDITDLHSEDSTDDESKPRKKIPLWAQGQIHSFIHLENSYNAPSRNILRGAPSPTMVKRSVLSVCRAKVCNSLVKSNLSMHRT